MTPDPSPFDMLACYCSACNKTTIYADESTAVLEAARYTLLKQGYVVKYIVAQSGIYTVTMYSQQPRPCSCSQEQRNKTSKPPF